MFDHQFAGDDVTDKFIAIGALQGIGEKEIFGHDALEGFAVAADERLNPLIVHLAKLLFDCYLLHLCRPCHGTSLKIRQIGNYAPSTLDAVGSQSINDVFSRGLAAANAVGDARATESVASQVQAGMFGYQFINLFDEIEMTDLILRH